VTPADEEKKKEDEDEAEAAVDEAAETPDTETEATDESPDDATDDKGSEPKKPSRATLIVAYGVLPALVLLLALGAGLLKWFDVTGRDAQTARVESVRAATDSTIAMLSYRADSAEQDLGAASDRLTGQFKDAYGALTHDVVIPGAKEKHISATARVPGAASVSATDKHAVVLVFVNQVVTIGADPPSSTASSVRVTLDKIDGRWLISDFTPV
jgi:Mce-associated membrane protein